MDPGSEVPVEVPESFLAMPRWWTEGAAWLAGLPRAIRDQCARWRLRVDGPLAHGSNAVAVPVTRGGEAYVLRMEPPGPAVDRHVAALRFWRGRGTVTLIEADPGAGALLLERLAMDRSAGDLPVPAAMAVLGRMMRRLAVPAPPWAPSTATLLARRSAEFDAQWRRLGRPFDADILAAGYDAGRALAGCVSTLAVNGDLHSGQVLAGTREPWLAVDPVLLRGDIAYDLARVLWTRVDGMAGAPEIVAAFDIVVREAGLDRDRARDWVVYRAVDYWLWGLDAGLTEDPQRCRRVLVAFL